MELAKHTIDRLAKALWFYSELGEQAPLHARDELIRLLEDKIREKFHRWILPELELALFQGINLINSNLPREELMGILEDLRASNVGWASQVEPKGDRLVLAKLPSISNVPGFDAAEDALSYMALNAAGRSQVYQLNGEEYEMAAKSIRMLGLDHKVNRRHLRWAHLIGWINIVAAFVLGILVLQYDLMGDLVRMVIELIHGPSQTVPSMIISSRKPVAVALATVVILSGFVLQLRLNDRLVSKGEVSQPLWQLLPFITWITKNWCRLRGRDQVERDNDDN